MIKKLTFYLNFKLLNMKKILLILFLSVVSTTIYAQTPQVRANSTEDKYANGDSYGFYIDEIPGAVSYEWSVQGTTDAHIWPAWDTAIDLTFSHSGYCDVICTVTMDNNTVVVYSLYIGVGSAP